MALSIEKLTAAASKKENLSKPVVQKSISIQTCSPNDQVPKVASPEKVFTPPRPKSLKKDDWHYAIVSKIPPTYSANQIAHYVKEKLGTTDFIRCFPMLKSKDSSYSEFKVGVKDKCHLEQMKNLSMWPPGTLVDTTISATSSSPLLISTPALNSANRISKSQQSNSKSAESQSPRPRPNPEILNGAMERRTIKIGCDKEAIAYSKSMVLENSDIIVEKATMKDKPDLDPMTPPIVRLSRDSDAANGRYLLARLRDPSILKPLRLFLAYLHDQPSNVCFEGHTCTSIKLALASEGLPSDVDSLRKLYYRFHDAYGISQTEVDTDLAAFSSYFSSEKLLRLQKIRESHSNYYSSGSPTRKTNF